MDRPLDSSIIKQRLRKRIVQITIAVAGIIGLFVLLSAWISPSVHRNDIRTAFVERGIVQATISASGTVVPAYEQSLSSPAETRVINVLARPGEHLKKGQPILDLDLSETKLALEQVEKNLSLKENNKSQLKLDMNRTIRDLKGQLNIKSLRLEYLESKLSQQQKMFNIGAISKDQLDQAKLDEQIATIERQELDSTINSTNRSLENQLAGLVTEIQTLQRERTNTQQQLEMLSCRATRDGILTWANQTVGATIHKGDIVAKIADLSSYRVEATTSDIHARHIMTGLPVQIRLNESSLDGKISSVFPNIEEGILKFQVELSGRTDSLLRPNLRVDVFVVTNNRGEALRVQNGPFVTGDGLQDVFVIRGSKAYRTPVHIGVLSFNYIEIADGLQQGDEVIISDMKEFIHLKELNIK